MKLRLLYIFSACAITLFSMSANADPVSGQGASIQNEDAHFGRPVHSGDVDAPIVVKDSETYIWAMQVLSGRSSILTKLNTDGETLWKFETGQSNAIGVDPRDGSVWVPSLSNDELLKVDASGNVLLIVPDLRGGTMDVDPIDGSVWFGQPGVVVKLDDAGQELFRVPGFTPQGHGRDYVSALSAG